ncbi:hypothetical protein DMP23_19890 [Amycolatopsis sp. A1MSW2902]|uniref:hypothetical protein n=1 Tax=Amycolatopsis sp. A1MSW2902 TaxID=687413 RepID=UPI00307F59FC
MPVENRLSLERLREILDRLGRYLPPAEDDAQPHLGSVVEIVGAVASSEPGFDEAHRAAGLPTASEVTAADVAAALMLVPEVRADLDAAERRLIDAGLDRGESFATLARARGMSREGMHRHYLRLGRTRPKTENT